MNVRPAIKTILCGVGGYGEYYLGTFLDMKTSPIEFVGFVDPAAERSPLFTRIRDMGVPICASLEEFYVRSRAELAIVASPIQFHCPQTLLALSHGSHVLCEKPLAASVAEAVSMIEAQRRAGRVVAIGYQGSFLDSTRRLKADILAGVWGRPVAFKCLVPWGRSREYYLRNRWAGRVRDEAGRAVMDSPVNNAASHFLHHMLYLLGTSPGRSAAPLEVEAQLYRAHAIENYDTAFLRCRVEGNATVLFIVSHCGARHGAPRFELAFENGTVSYALPADDIGGVLRDGSRRSYGVGAISGEGKVFDTVEAIREGRESLCGIEAAMSQTLVMAAAQDSGSPVVDIPRELIREINKDNQRWLEVRGLNDLLMAAYNSARLPEPAGPGWIKPARAVNARIQGERRLW